MTNEEKLELLSQTIEAEPGELKHDTILEELDYWDSLAKLSLLAMFASKFDRNIEVSAVRGFRTVSDILNEMHD